MKKYIYYMFFALRQTIFFCISALIPKNKNLWIFGAWQGELYADNPKYFFEFVELKKKEIVCVWITKNKDVFQKLVSNGHTACLYPSIKALLFLLRAGIVIESEGNRDIGGFRLYGTKVIQLWHGAAPKRANWNDKRKLIKKCYDKIFVDNHAKSYWMASSEENKNTIHELFGARKDRTFVTGYSRNDVFTKNNNKSIIYCEIENKHSKLKKLIYMPTHRNFGTEGLPFSEKELTIVDKKLKDNNCIMYYKPHFHELKNYQSIITKFTNIIFSKNDYYSSDVYSYINDFDLLISDYSSIIYDFLCSNKPIVLFAYDIEHFRDFDAGLFDDYESQPFGPICYSWEEVLINSFKFLKSDDEWKKEREIYQKKFHPFNDGLNSNRIYTAIESILNK